MFFLEYQRSLTRVCAPPTYVTPLAPTTPSALPRGACGSFESSVEAMRTENAMLSARLVDEHAKSVKLSAEVLELKEALAAANRDAHSANVKSFGMLEQLASASLAAHKAGFAKAAAEEELVGCEETEADRMRDSDLHSISECSSGISASFREWGR